MDFVSVTDIAIPEGEVTKIQDADMTVLWKKGEVRFIGICVVPSEYTLCGNMTRQFRVIIED